MPDAKAKAAQRLHHAYFLMRQNHDANELPPELEPLYNRMLQGIIESCQLLGVPIERWNRQYTQQKGTHR